MEKRDSTSTHTDLQAMDVKHLHIICFDVPYPVDYGGVFDLFYKIKTLSEAGVKIHLHCYEYGRGHQSELNKYCSEVNYYERFTGITGFSFLLPYIVYSRRNKRLLQNLQKDSHPILMEGMHCTYFLHTGQLPAKRCFVRLCNVEFEYYSQIAGTSSSLFKKMYYRWESRLLKKYEASLANNATFWSVTEKDMLFFNDKLGYKSIDYLPLFLPEYGISSVNGKGNYCLYNGNLGISENEQAVVWLIENVFSKTDVPFVIAGKNPSEKLEELVHKHPNMCLVANPSDLEMQDLIQKAQVNVLPSLNNTGIKLKLVNALYNGRHCVVNQAGVEGTGLDCCCTIANSAKSMRDAVSYLYEQPLTQYTYAKRINRLQSIFNNAANAQQMIGWIFKGEATVPGGWLKRKQLM